MNLEQADEAVVQAAQHLAAVNAKPPAEDANAYKRSWALIELADATIALIASVRNALETAVRAGDHRAAAIRGQSLYRLIQNAVKHGVSMNAAHDRARDARKIQVAKEMPPEPRLVKP